MVLCWGKSEPCISFCRWVICSGYYCVFWNYRSALQCMHFSGLSVSVSWEWHDNIVLCLCYIMYYYYLVFIYMIVLCIIIWKLMVNMWVFLCISNCFRDIYLIITIHGDSSFASEENICLIEVALCLFSVWFSCVVEDCWKEKAFRH